MTPQHHICERHGCVCRDCPGCDLEDDDGEDDREPPESEVDWTTEKEVEW